MKRLIILLLLIFSLALPAFADECQQCGPPPSGGPSGGPSDDGPETGGHTLLTGEMILGIKKEVSLNGWNYVDANSPENAFFIPEERDSTVYFRVTVTNVSDLTAINIRLTHDFDEALTDMVAEELIFAHNSIGYDAETREFRIDELAVGQSITFTYTILIHELGQSDEKATDTITITEYKNKLPIYHDGLKYLSIGHTDTDYLVAGSPGEVKGATTDPNDPNYVPDFSTPPLKLAPTGMPIWIVIFLGLSGICLWRIIRPASSH